MLLDEVWTAPQFFKIRPVPDDLLRDSAPPAAALFTSHYAFTSLFISSYNMLCKKSTIPLEFTKQFSFSVMMGKLPSLFLLLWYSSCTHLTNAKQFRDYSYSDLSKLVEELDGPFASVQSADKLWGHKDLVGHYSHTYLSFCINVT